MSGVSGGEWIVDCRVETQNTKRIFPFYEKLPWSKEHSLHYITEIKGKYTTGFGVWSSIFLYCSVWMDRSNLQSRL